jgi:hypothetical protein
MHQRGLNDEEGRAGVDRDQGVPKIWCRVLEAKPGGVASVVDQNVEGLAYIPFCKLIVESLEQGRDGRGIDEVRLDRKRSTSSFRWS